MGNKFLFNLTMMPINRLLTIAIIALGYNLSWGYSPFGLSCILYLLGLLIASVIDRDKLGHRWLQKWAYQQGISVILLSMVALIFAFDVMATPVSAQFMQNAESWMEGQFEAAADVIPLVFNVLRGLFLLYLGISLVKVINALREDEDWKSLARTPLIILIAVTLGDVLASLIVGEGGGA